LMMMMMRGPLLSVLPRSMALSLHVSLLIMCRRVTTCLTTHPPAWARCTAREPHGSLGVPCSSWSEVCLLEQPLRGCGGLPV
jgi:hypothetical protein